MDVDRLSTPSDGPGAVALWARVVHGMAWCVGQEVMGMLLAGAKEAESNFAKITDLLSQLDEDGDGTLTLEEFKVRR